MPRTRLKKSIASALVIDNPQQDALGVVLPRSHEIEPFSPQAIDLRRLIDKAVTEDDWIAIITKAASEAKEGNRSAREFLTKYRFGLPAPASQDLKGGGNTIQIIEVSQMSEYTPDE